MVSAKTPGSLKSASARRQRCSSRVGRGGLAGAEVGMVLGGAGGGDHADGGRGEVRSAAAGSAPWAARTSRPPARVGRRRWCPARGRGVAQPSRTRSASPGMPGLADPVECGPGRGRGRTPGSAPGCPVEGGGRGRRAPPRSAARRRGRSRRRSPGGARTPRAWSCGRPAPGPRVVHEAVALDGRARPGPGPRGPPAARRRSPPGEAAAAALACTQSAPGRRARGRRRRAGLLEPAPADPDVTTGLLGRRAEATTAGTARLAGAASVPPSWRSAPGAAASLSGAGDRHERVAAPGKIPGVHHPADGRRGWRPDGVPPVGRPGGRRGRRGGDALAKGVGASHCSSMRTTAALLVGDSTSNMPSESAGDTTSNSMGRVAPSESTSKAAVRDSPKSDQRSHFRGGRRRCRASP